MVAEAVLPREVKGISKDEVHESCSEPDEATKGFMMQQTMLRIKDPRISIDFYTRILGMRLLKQFDFAPMEFSLYFMGYEDESTIPKDEVERGEWVFTRPSTIELTHNWGTQDDPKFKGFHNGNSNPKGFGHIGITVPDVNEACERFERLGVPFIKKPNEGMMKDLAFVQDPDGYWIEILNPAMGRKVAMMMA